MCEHEIIEWIVRFTFFQFYLHLKPLFYYCTTQEWPFSKSIFLVKWNEWKFCMFKCNFEFYKQSHIKWNCTYTHFYSKIKILNRIKYYNEMAKLLINGVVIIFGRQSSFFMAFKYYHTHTRWFSIFNENFSTFKTYNHRPSNVLSCPVYIVQGVFVSNPC